MRVLVFGLSGGLPQNLSLSVGPDSQSEVHLLPGFERVYQLNVTLTGLHLGVPVTRSNTLFAIVPPFEIQLYFLTRTLKTRDTIQESRGTSAMKAISHAAPELDPYRDEISKHVATYESMGMSYWLFVEESNPIAVYFTGHEPVNLLLPMGTPVSMIQVLNYDVSSKVLAEVASEALRMGVEHGVKYVLSPSTPATENLLMDAFTQKGFEEHARWYRMTYSLKDVIEVQDPLRFETIERDDLRGFIEWLGHCMTGSQGGQEDVTLSNLLEVPDQLLDFWYTQQELYNVYRDDDLIGALNLTPGSDTNLNNVGVTPEQRGKGYGRQITLQALNRLRELDKEKARLRVHAENKPAIGLYKSLGFEVEEETADLIVWWDGPE